MHDTYRDGVFCSGGSSDRTNKCVTNTHLVACRHKKLRSICKNRPSPIVNQTLQQLEQMAILVPPCHHPWWSAHMRAALAPEVMGRRSMCGSNPMQIPAPMGQNILLVEVTCTHALQ